MLVTFDLIHLLPYTSVYLHIPLCIFVYFCNTLPPTITCDLAYCHSCTENVGELGVSVLEHPAMAGELRNAKNGPSALKHLRQQVSSFTHKCFSW